MKLCLANSVTGCTALFRRSLLDKALPFPIETAHDHWLALLAKDGGGIAYYPHPTMSYRQHGNNAMGAKSAEAYRTIARKEARSFAELVREREKMNRKGLARFAGLAEAAEGRISERNRKRLLRLERYYKSYFTARIRIDAFLFHLFHYRVLSDKKSIAQGLYGLTMSLFGIGRVR